LRAIHDRHGIFAASILHRQLTSVGYGLTQIFFFGSFERKEGEKKKRRKKKIRKRKKNLSL